MQLNYVQTRRDVTSFELQLICLFTLKLRSGHNFNLIDKYPLYVHFPRIKITSGSDVG